MKEEKNLDRLFQEKFKDFERHPSAAVWKKIARAQNEEEDRKIIPLWWKLGGAAAIALLFTAGIILFNNSSTSGIENSVVTKDETPDTNTNQTTPSQQISIPIVNAEDSNALSEVVANGRDNKRANNIPLGKENVNTSAPKQEVYVQNTNQTQTTSYIGNTTVQGITTPSQEVLKEADIAQENRFKTNNPLVNEAKSKEILKEQLNANTSVTESTQDIQETPQEINEEKISLVEEAKRIEEENEALALVEESTAEPRWDVGAVAAPVFYRDFGGSGLDPSFSDNAKSSDLNFSYGVQVSYAVSPKLKVRTGVSNVDLSYNTNGIAFTASPGARNLSGINFNENARALNIGDAGNVRIDGATGQDDLFPENANTANIINGSLQQRIGFVEIPVEAVYAISNKRLGVQVVGGLSTLLLNNNEVILNSEDGLQSNLGSANGINDVSFTTNIGLGLDYKLTDKLKFNVEPSLKYQLNAFDESVGDFKPYFVGLYTGVSYRF